MEEEASNITTNTPRKVRYSPKIPPRKTPRPAEIKSEVVTDSEAEAAQTRQLLKRVTENIQRRGPKVERKSAQVQVSFGYPGEATSSIRTFGGGSGSSLPRPQDPVFEDGHKALGEKKKTDYTDPWKYSGYYPVTLPMRRANSGNPELLDEEEFGEASANLDDDESSINPAVELGLMEESKGGMLFLQLPAALPLVRRSSRVKGKEIPDNFKRIKNTDPPERGCSLEGLPAGFMGKMLVYKSGAIKLKLGEVVYDVSPGSDCIFAQDVAAINVEGKHCCVLGELNKRAIITPDVDSLLEECD